MVSSGTDNCIKMWVFDSPDGTARLLRSREGHRAPPHAIRYYGNTTLATMAEGAGEWLQTAPYWSWGLCAIPRVVQSSMRGTSGWARQTLAYFLPCS